MAKKGERCTWLRSCKLLTADMAGAVELGEALLTAGEALLYLLLQKLCPCLQAADHFFTTELRDRAP